MSAHALLIEPEENTRDWATDLLERQGFEVTDLARWPDDVDDVLSESTTFVLVEAETFEKHRNILREIRDRDESLPVIVFGPGKLSTRALNSALEAGMVQYTLTFEKAVDAAVHTFRASLKRASAWQDSPAQVRERLALARPPRSIPHLPELHDPATGRVDAARVAEYLGMPLAFMAKALNRKYSTIAKTPAAESLQESLRDFERIIEVLQHVLGEPAHVRIWMSSPHPDLDYKTPREILQSGNASAVRRMIDSTLSGNLT